MLRNIVAVLVGLIVAFALVAGIEKTGHLIYPPPASMDLTDPKIFAEYRQLIPLGALLFVLAAWTMATFVGGLVACRIAGERPLLMASIIGALVMAGSVATLAIIPHPTWFAISAVILIVMATFLAGRISSNS